MEPLTEEQKKLVENHMYVAERVARRHVRGRGMLRYDEALSAASMGLMDAAKLYDPERGVAFSTYCYRRCMGSVVDYARDSLPGPRREKVSRISLDQPPAGASEDDEHQCEFMPETVDRDPGYLDFWDGLCKQMPLREFVMFQQYWRYGKTMRQIALQHDISESSVSKIISRLNRVAKNKLADWEHSYGSKQTDLARVLRSGQPGSTPPVSHLPVVAQRTDARANRVLPQTVA